MGVLDAVVNEAGSQLGISSSSAGSVLSGLLSFINQQDGGVGAFLDRFRQAGVGNLVTSWLHGDTKSVAPEAVENALGRDTINNIASKSGLSFSAAASAIAVMLPKLIQRLAPGGNVPTRLPSEFASYVTGPTAAMASGARQATHAAQSMATTGARRSWWPVLLLVLLAGLLAYWLSGRNADNVIQTAFNAREQARLVTDRATRALDSLRPGYSAQDVAEAMNLEVINFAPGSSQLPT